jgi:hypothetical protein
MGVFSEALTGLPTGAATWQLGGVAPLAIGTFDHFIVRGGPIISYRSGGNVQSDVGMVMLTGASIPIGRGLALNPRNARDRDVRTPGHGLCRGGRGRRKGVLKRRMIPVEAHLILDHVPVVRLIVGLGFRRPGSDKPAN